MKKRILLVFLAMALVVSLVAFAACKEEEVVIEEWQWPDKLALVTTANGGMSAMTGWASEMQKDTGMTIRIVPETSTMRIFKWVAQGRFFVCGEATTVVNRVIEAEGEWAARDAGPFQLRLVWPYSQVEAGFMVRGDSDIKTIYDIKPGTKFVDYAFFPGFREGFPFALLAWAGVDPEDIEWIPGSTYAACMRFIQEGKADVAFCFPLSPSVMEAAAAPHGIRFLDLTWDEDPVGAERFLDIEPAASFGVMRDIPQTVGVKGIVGLTPLMTRVETDTELVYHFVKWLDENYDLYKDNHTWNQFMTMDNLLRIVETWFVPSHDGLIKYLKEKGLWTAAHDVRQQQNIEFLTSYVEAYQKAIEMADAQGIVVDYENDEWTELWENYKKQLGLPGCRTYLGLEE